MSKNTNTVLEQFLPQASFEDCELIEIQGTMLSDGQHHWLGGFHILFREYIDEQWWYAITRLINYDLLDVTTKISDPILYPEKLLRRPLRVEKFVQIRAHLKGKEFIQSYAHYWRQKLADIPRVKV